MISPAGVGGMQDLIAHFREARRDSVPTESAVSNGTVRLGMWKGTMTKAIKLVYPQGSNGRGRSPGIWLEYLERSLLYRLTSLLTSC